MEQRTKFKKIVDANRGITLIALVITIILLLILARVSIWNENVVIPVL